MLRSEGANGKHEMCRFSVSDILGPALMMGVLARQDSHWNFHALGCPVSGYGIFALLRVRNHVFSVLFSIGTEICL